MGKDKTFVRLALGNRRQPLHNFGLKILRSVRNYLVIRIISPIAYKAVNSGILLLSAAAVVAGPVFQPPGTNLSFGDVTHGQRIQSASGNPAAAAADLARNAEVKTRGVVLSAAAGLEYGNVQNLFDFYDAVTGAYEPSDPRDGPGQDPPNKPPRGINPGDIWDSLDPDFSATISDSGSPGKGTPRLFRCGAVLFQTYYYLSSSMPCFRVLDCRRHLA